MSFRNVFVLAALAALASARATTEEEVAIHRENRQVDMMDMSLLQDLNTGAATLNPLGAAPAPAPVSDPILAAPAMPVTDPLAAAAPAAAPAVPVSAPLTDPSLSAPPTTDISAGVPSVGATAPLGGAAPLGSTTGAAAPAAPAAPVNKGAVRAMQRGPLASLDHKVAKPLAGARTIGTSTPGDLSDGQVSGVADYVAKYPKAAMKEDDTWTTGTTDTVVLTNSCGHKLVLGADSNVRIVDPAGGLDIYSLNTAGVFPGGAHLVFKNGKIQMYIARRRTRIAKVSLPENTNKGKMAVLTRQGILAVVDGAGSVLWQSKTPVSPVTCNDAAPAAAAAPSSRTQL